MNAWLTPAVEPPGTYVCRRLLIPNDVTWLAIVNGALNELCYSSSFEQLEGISPEDTADAFRDMYAKYSTEDFCMIGVILPYATASLPTNTLACDGASHLRTDYPLLYAALDGAFITDADHFITPDLRGRTVLGTGSGTGLSTRNMGDSDGVERVTLSLSEIASHTHGESIAVPTLINGGLEAPATSATASTGSTGSAGGDASHNNMMPFLALGYCIIAR